MNLSDIPEITQALIAIGALLIAIFSWLRAATKKSARLLTDIATKGVEKVTEGVAILTMIDLKVDHIDQRLKEVKSEMVEVQTFISSSQRDRAELRLKVEDHERRLTTLEGREVNLSAARQSE